MSPADPVNNPAEVIVPEVVVEILLEVEIVLAVEILPKPEAIDPEASAPTVVKEEVTTIAFNVAPVNVPAAAVIVLVVPYEIVVPLIVVEVVAPVPPLATTNVPASVIAPLVAAAGVNPVVPPAKVVTPVVDVRKVVDATFSTTPVDVFLVRMS